MGGIDNMHSKVAIEATIDGKKANIILIRDYIPYLTVDYYVSTAMCKFDKGVVLLSVNKKVPYDKLISMMDFYVSGLNLIIRGNIEIPHMDTDKLQMCINNKEKVKVIKLLKEDTGYTSAIICGFDELDIKKTSTAFYIMIERFFKNNKMAE